MTNSHVNIKNDKSKKQTKTKKKQFEKIHLLHTNAADLKHKSEDLKNKIKYFETKIFSLNETHYKKKGHFKLENFVIFEAIRKNKEKGGTMIGIHEGLKPVLIEEYNETFELIVTEIDVEKKKVRVMSGYGPQETWTEEERMPFWVSLEKEIASAEINGRSIIIQMDANAKLGPTHIKNDPKPISENGKVLAGIMERHGLIVANSLQDKCTGLITREKTTVNGIEKSVIDFVIVSNDLVKHIEKIHIDDERKHVLTKIMKNKKNTDITESDHNMIETVINIPWKSSEIVKMEETYNYKDAESLKEFKENTTNTKDLSKIFDTEQNPQIKTKKFMKRLQGFIKNTFRKIKITNKPDETLESMYNKRRLLRSKIDTQSKKELKELEDELAEKYSEKMYNTIKNEIDCINSEDGGFNSGKLWKLKKKLSPTNTDPPTAMLNSEGKLLTDEEEIKEEAKKHYKKVFEDKPMADSVKHIRKEREKLCMKRLEASKKIKTPPWTSDDVTNAIKDLKKKVSKDPYDIPNELVMIENAGDDLILAITKLMNMMKDESVFPKALNLCNVTNAYKNKGERNSFDSYRGLFRTPVFRNILDRLLYNDMYETVDSNLTDCNVGCRKGRNVRDNLFVINAITNEARQKNAKPCDVCAYDVRKCFDCLWLQECINDMWEAGLQNDKLNLLFLANETAQIVIKTSSGKTDRITIHNTVMQGTVWGGLFCTCTMDKLGKEAYADPQLLYRYRGTVEVPPLEMVDDVVIASECGSTTSTSNAHMNSFIERKKLQLSKDKCARIHIGAKNKCGDCATIFVHDEEMKSSEKEKYLGDYISKEGNSNETIKDRIKRGYGILAQIKAIRNDMKLDLP